MIPRPSTSPLPSLLCSSWPPAGGYWGGLLKALALGLLFAYLPPGKTKSGKQNLVSFFTKPLSLGAPKLLSCHGLHYNGKMLASVCFGSKAEGDGRGKVGVVALKVVAVQGPVLDLLDLDRASAKESVK